MAAVLVGVPALTACSGGRGESIHAELKGRGKESAEVNAGKGNEELPVLRVLSLHPAYISTPVAYAIAMIWQKEII